MAQVAGANARELRLAAPATLEQFAATARVLGLRWTSGRVGDFEAGRTSPTAPTLIVVAAVLTKLLGRQVAVDELFAGEGPVAVTDRLTIDRADIRSAFCEGIQVTLGDLPVELENLRKRTSEWVERVGQWPESVSAVPMGRHRDVYRAMSDSDLRMCKNIGVDRSLGAAAMATLWGKPFTARRDELAGPDANAQHRGQISRQLKAELQKVLSDGDD